MVEWRYSSTVVDLVNSRRRVINFTHLSLYHRGNRLHCPAVCRCVWVGLKSGFERYVEVKNFLPLPGIKPGSIALRIGPSICTG
jgi:hypothetical protein